MTEPERVVNAEDVVIDIFIGEDEFKDWDPKRLTFGEADAIERAFGGTLEEFGKQAFTGNIGALRILVWSLLRRKNNGLLTTDLDDMELGEVRIEVNEKPKKDAGEVEAPAGSDSPTGASASSEPSTSSSPSDPGSGTD